MNSKTSCEPTISAPLMADFDDRLHEVPVSVANAQVMVVPCQVEYHEGSRQVEAHLVIARKHCRGEQVQGAVLRRLAQELAQMRGAPSVCIDVNGRMHRFR